MVCKQTIKLSRVSLSLIGCPILSALCHIEAKSFVNFNIIIKRARGQLFAYSKMVSSISMKF